LSTRTLISSSGFELIFQPNPVHTLQVLGRNDHAFVWIERSRRPDPDALDILQVDPAIFRCVPDAPGDPHHDRVSPVGQRRRTSSPPQDLSLHVDEPGARIRPPEVDAYSQLR
jgi:hypothetical protein